MLAESIILLAESIILLPESIILLTESIVLSDCQCIRLGKSLLLLWNYSYCTGILVKAKAFVFECIGDVFYVFADVRRAETIVICRVSAPKVGAVLRIIFGYALTV